MLAESTSFKSMYQQSLYCYSGIIVTMQQIFFRLNMPGFMELFVFTSKALLSESV